MSLPFILIFDIDYTMIGNVGYPYAEAKLMELIYKNCKQKDISDKCINKVIDFTDVMEDGLLRPDLSEFVKFCDKKYKNVEVFVYTNSPYKWAQDIMIQQIEKVSDIKFNKPYFTRENSSILMKKQLSHIWDTICNQLSKKYPKLSNNPKMQKYVFDNRFMMIDDQKGVVDDFPNKQIVCPEYTYIPYYDIPDKIIRKYKISPSVFDNNEILEFCNSQSIPIYNPNGSDLQKDMLYVSLQKASQMRQSELSKKSDTFFKTFIELLKNTNEVNDKVIQKINATLAKL
jgi:hypothetical protein